MRKLLDFLIRKRHWFLFILLEVVSCIFLYYNQAYHRNLILGSSNTLVGHISSISGAVRSYIGLKGENRALFERNGQLELQVMRLEREIEMLKAQALTYDSLFVADSVAIPYHYVTAGVVNSNVSLMSNYLTIDKGLRDGVKPDMGVVSTGGVVGIVSVADEHFSVVIPVLNPKLHISCKLLTGNYYGSLSWDGRDTRYAYLDELPRHAVFKEGDTVVTSGFSAVFPANIMVGTVAKFEKGKDYNFYSLKIKLGTDFWALKSVRVIQNDFHDERTAIEEKARKND